MTEQRDKKQKLQARKAEDRSPAGVAVLRKAIEDGKVFHFAVDKGRRTIPVRLQRGAEGDILITGPWTGGSDTNPEIAEDVAFVLRTGRMITRQGFDSWVGNMHRAAAQSRFIRRNEGKRGYLTAEAEIAAKRAGPSPDLVEKQRAIFAAVEAEARAKLGGQ